MTRRSALRPVVVNGRVLKVASNGQKRVAEQLIQRMPEVEQTSPHRKFASGLPGHLWEQTALPLTTAGRRLWSPSTSGPILHPNHIVTVHDIAFVDGPEWFSPSFARLYDTIVARLVKSARHIVTVSDFTRDRLLEHYGASPDRVTTVHLGRSEAFTPSSEESTDRVLAGLGLLPQQYLVAFSGADPRKNTAAILKAWADRSDEHKAMRLVMFGRAANPSVFSTAAASAHDESVVMAGAVSDDVLASLYTGAAGFIFPSLYEGFGLPVVEAAACGCRIATSNLASMPEVSPADALLLDPRSHQSIVDAMNFLLSVPDTEADRAARRASVLRFDWDEAARRYTQVFEEHFQ